MRREGSSQGDSGKLAARLALAIASLVLSAAAAEVAARWLAPARPPVRFDQVHLGVRQTVEAETRSREGELREGKKKPISFAEVFEADPELFWRFVPSLRLSEDHWPLFGVISNGQRLREDHEVQVPKAEEEVRILFVGDSCAFGWQLPHTQTVSHFTEEQLRSRHPDLQIEALNAGVPAYSAFQGWRFLETEGMRYEPDLVVLNFAWNGNGSRVWDGRSDMQHHALLQASVPTGSLRHSRLYQMLWLALHPIPALPPGEARRPRLRREEYRDILGKIRETTSRHGADLVVLVAAGRPNLVRDGNTPEQAAFQSEAYYFGREMASGLLSGAAVLDLVPLVRAMTEETLVSELFFDDAHTTAKTNRAIAGALVQELEPWMTARSVAVRP